MRKYWFFSPIYFPSVMIHVSKTGVWACSILYIEHRCQGERLNAKQRKAFEQHVKLRSNPSHLFLLAGRLSSTSADESLSWTMSFISPPKVSPSTPSPPLPFTLPSTHWDHKLLNIKPCFQSVRRASRCQGPSHPVLHLWRHLGGKICLSLPTPLSPICAYIIQAATHTQGLDAIPPQGHVVAWPFIVRGTLC